MIAASPNGGVFDAKSFLESLTTRPGVYQMLDASGKVIYVGKARNLRKRVATYFTAKDASPKTRAMVAQIRDVQVIVTRTEAEALILENNVIKQHRPRYNIVWRDDKSYPFIYVSTEHPFPRIGFHRGAKKGKGSYFGPYPSASAVRESLQLLQKVFPVRQCEDAFFQNRSRPCLQYQIKRCTGPCVGLVEREVYAEDVHHAVMFLEGKSQQVVDELIGRMQQASEALDFERAARYRDQIQSLQRIQEKQYITGESGDIDVVAVAARGGMACVQVFFIREGRNLGNKSFFPAHAQEASPQDVLAAFLPQYYLGKDVPQEIIVNQELDEAALLADTLSEESGHKVILTARVRGERARWLAMAEQNATETVVRQLVSKAGARKRMEALQDALGLAELPERMECFDISHTQGQQTVASCVVFVGGAPAKSDYRRFNIEGIVPGDDYGALQQALTRRYRRLKEGEGSFPDVLFIDGGKGQVSAAVRALEELQVTGLNVIGVAKGEGRKPGLETLHLATGQTNMALPSDSPALHLVQQIRDEAHRFAVAGHRKRRDRPGRSPLEAIPGLGPQRRRNLLTHFGGLQGIVRAGIEDLARVPGISAQLARRIYETLHLADN